MNRGSKGHGFSVHGRIRRRNKGNGSRRGGDRGGSLRGIGTFSARVNGADDVIVCARSSMGVGVAAGGQDWRGRNDGVRPAGRGAVLDAVTDGSGLRSPSEINLTAGGGGGT